MTTLDALDDFELGRHLGLSPDDQWLVAGVKWLALHGTFRADRETASGLDMRLEHTKSLQYWLEAVGIAARMPGRLIRLQPTEFGKLLIDHDPYLETAPTAYLLHANLVRAPKRIWHWLFNDFLKSTFSRRECQSALFHYVMENRWKRTKFKEVEAEVECALETYAHTRPSIIAGYDDGLESYFRPFHLLAMHVEPNGFFKAPVPITPEVFLSVIGMTEMPAYRQNGSVIRAGVLVAGRNSPGRMFTLQWQDIEQLSREAADLYGHLGVENVRHSDGSFDGVMVPDVPPCFWYRKGLERSRAVIHAATSTVKSARKSV